MTIHGKHSGYQITTNCFYSRQDFGYPTKNIVNTTGCTLDNCVPIGLQTINATGRGNYIVPTNCDSPFCGKFFEYTDKISHYENENYSNIHST
jgi:hypothetical protein